MAPNPVSKKSVQFIFITTALDMMGIGLIIPVLPDVIRRFSTSPDQVNQYFGYFVALYALMQFSASPVLGGLSDRFGRRRSMIAALICAASWTKMTQPGICLSAAVPSKE